MFKKLSVVLIISLTACATSPTGRNQLIFMPDTQMDQMGLQAFDQMKKEKPISHQAKFNQIAQCIVTELTQGMGQNWEVVVFEDKTLNAFALPGAKIGVHTGMMQLVDNQDQLAAVLGHEVGHVLARHSNERASQETLVQQGMSIIKQTSYGQNPLIMAGLGLGAQYGVLMPYSRTHESEADIIGVDLMAKAGFDPTQSVTLWQKMEQASQNQPMEFMSTHPAHATRIQQLQEHMPQALEFYKQAQAAGRQPKCR
ncbi:MAG: M48 family metallopeptidase [Methylococcales bacterium]|nr:M48 family metallopeptidase [Methylococcales bacterium]MDD5754152.1 M48 family metallopeptidase [Methylococcales bacterium]